MQKPLTEQDSNFNQLENMSTHELLKNINNEDKTVAHAVSECIEEIEKLVSAVYPKMKNGGRLFYIGAGTSGRLGIVDASECPPTFGVDHGVVVGIIAGGDSAIRKAVEFAEDDKEQSWKDLEQHNINENDSVIGIAASGSTPYVVGGLTHCNANNILTGCITCKISTSLMVKLGHVIGNKMVDMQLSNNKLVERGTRMIMDEIDVSETKAKELLLKFGSVRKAVENHNA